MSYRAVIFDIDGTLLDSVDLHAEAWRQIFLRYGRDIPFGQIRAQIGKGGDQLLPVFFSQEEVADIGKDMEEERTKLFKAEFMPKVRPFPGVRPLFERIKKDGLKIALASSATKAEVKHYAQLLEIEDLVETSASSDDAAKSKPHPDIFEGALNRLGKLPASEALAVGDTPYDAQAASKIGIKTIGFLCGGFPADDLRGAGVVALYLGPADLLHQYDASPLGRR